MSFSGARQGYPAEVPWGPDDGHSSGWVDGGGPVAPHPLAMPLFIALHVPLAIVMRYSPAAATIHALATLLFGLRFALANSVERVAYIGAYIAGADVLWRMCGARVFWEMGKYSLCLVFLVALFRSNSYRPPLLSLAYFALLLPSILLVIQAPDVGRLRSDLSFNLSGPLSLMVASWFYSRLSMSKEEALRLLLTLLAPITGILAIALFGIATRSQIKFTGESNFATSGGFGPNQVSALLGLGALIAFLLFLNRDRGGPPGVIFLGMIVAFATQSALTFSRTGLYCACGGILAASIGLTCDMRTRLRFILAAVTVACVANYVLIPVLDTFTKGRISNRFTQTNTTGRDSLMKEDLDVFLENPLLGVGPGGSKANHHGLLASHSEVTRLLAEHGCLGMAALLLLGLMAFLSYRRSRTNTERSVKIALLSWSLLILASNAMRYVAPSFIFGVCSAVFAFDETDEAKS